MKERNWVYETLLKDARYAIASKSRELVYETYGAAKMAWCLDRITKDQFYTFNDMLIVKTLNNGRLMNEWDREDL